MMVDFANSPVPVVVLTRRPLSKEESNGPCWITVKRNGRMKAEERYLTQIGTADEEITYSPKQGGTEEGCEEVSDDGWAPDAPEVPRGPRDDES